MIHQQGIMAAMLASFKSHVINFFRESSKGVGELPPLPNTLDDLKSNIEREIRNIPKDALEYTLLIFKKGANYFCLP